MNSLAPIPGSAMRALGFWLNEARIGTVEGGELGLLVWKFDQLVAVLTRIDEEAYSTKGKRDRLRVAERAAQEFGYEQIHLP
jgi:hypothetical protein